MDLDDVSNRPIGLLFLHLSNAEFESGNVYTLNTLKLQTCSLLHNTCDNDDSKITEEINATMSFSVNIEAMRYETRYTDIQTDTDGPRCVLRLGKE
jgi:hypothetical protein